MSKHVAVLMGGWSSERPVSLSSGNRLRRCAGGGRLPRHPCRRQRDIADVLSRLRPDVAFNALHGPYGEDGCIQGILEILEIPYTHSGVLASALAMNKPKAKDVMKAAGIPVAEVRPGPSAGGGCEPTSSSRPMWSSRRTRARASACIIVNADATASAAAALRRRLAARRHRHGRALCRRARADLRRARRSSRSM